MPHEIVAVAENILDRSFPVLDKGFVRLVDYMGSDKRIVNAARVSHGRHEQKMSDMKDQKLIEYLIKNKHTSPFEQVVFTFHCKMPIFVARQWVRHRTARLNEISARYTKLKNEYYVPYMTDVRAQGDEKDKQSGNGELYDNEASSFINSVSNISHVCFTHYKDALDNTGIARELSRIILPLNTYTEWYWQMDLNNLFHFLNLRMSSHAQLEIRKYAKVISKIVSKVVPIAYEAFEEHILNGVSISLKEYELLKYCMSTHCDNCLHSGCKAIPGFREKFGLEDS